MDDRFKQVEDEYFRLKGLLAAGRVTQEQFDAALKELMIQDAQGRWWMIGADGGKWSVHDGSTWAEADPAAIQLAKPIRPSNRMPLIVIGAAVVVLLAFGGIFVAARMGIVNAGGIFNSSRTVVVVPAAPTIARAALPTVAFRSTAAAFPTAPPNLPTAAPSPTETASSAPTPIVIAATETQVLLSPAPATLAPTNSPTVISPSPTGLAANVAASSTPSPNVTPTTAFAPGVYVTGLRSDPAEPKNLQHISFFATFVNSTGAAENYRWCIEIWDPNSSQKNSFGVTSCQPGTIPAGTMEIPALDNTYHIVRGGQCLPLRARVIRVDVNNARIPFLQPDGSIFWYNFQVCPVT
jgi:hypothetical protein